MSDYHETPLYQIFNELRHRGAAHSFGTFAEQWLKITRAYAYTCEKHSIELYSLLAERLNRYHHGDLAKIAQRESQRRISERVDAERPI